MDGSPAKKFNADDLRHVLVRTLYAGGAAGVVAACSYFLTNVAPSWTPGPGLGGLAVTALVALASAAQRYFQDTRY